MSENQKQKWFTPVAIVIAGVVIAGAIIYTPSERGEVKNATDQAEQLSYIALAEELDLDIDKFSACMQNRTHKEEVEKDLADGIAAGVEGTPTSFVNGRKLVGAVPYTTFQTAIEAALAGEVIEGAPALDDDTVLGRADAPVEIVMFGDFECPFCGRLYLGAEQDIIRDYIDTGKAKMVYRDFPLTSIHPTAVPSAEAAECAADQDKYWEYHDALFNWYTSN